MDSMRQSGSNRRNSINPLPQMGGLNLRCRHVLTPLFNGRLKIRKKEPRIKPVERTSASKLLLANDAGALAYYHQLVRCHIRNFLDAAVGPTNSQVCCRRSTQAEV